MTLSAQAGQAGVDNTTAAVINDMTEIRAYTFIYGEPRWLHRLEDIAGALLQRADTELDPDKARDLRQQALQLTGVAWGGLAAITLAGEDSPPRPPANELQRILASTQALAQAYARIGRDPGLAATLPLRIDHAIAQTDTGQEQAAIAELKDLYDNLKATLAYELDGTTVISELAFATPADEYLYELDRHDAHLLMLRHFFADAMTEAGVAAAVVEAARHHIDAHQQALAGQHEQAIGLLEHSNGELIELLRSRGLNIPG